MHLPSEGLVGASWKWGNQTQVAVAHAMVYSAVAVVSLVARVALGQVPGTLNVQNAPVAVCRAPTASSYLAPHAAWATSPGAAFTKGLSRSRVAHPVTE